MSEILPENVSLLNFTFLSAAFYNYLVNSDKIFQKVKSKKKEEEYSTNKKSFFMKSQCIENNKEYDLEKEFEKLNNENFMDYYNYLSYLNNDDIKIKQEKLKLIKSVFNFEFNENEKEIIFCKLNEKMNYSIFSDKYQLIKLLSIQIMNFLFDIYELIYKIIINMEESKNKTIQNLISNNLLEEEKKEKNTKKAKQKILKENSELKCNIESLRQLINQNTKNMEIIIQKNNHLENEIKMLKENEIILKEEIKNIKKNAK